MESGTNVELHENTVIIEVRSNKNLEERIIRSKERIRAAIIQPGDDKMGSETSLDFLIACVIMESENQKKPIWFKKLEKILDGRASRATISKNVDKLFDYGIINGEWILHEGKWIRTFHISGEASSLVGKIYKEHSSTEDVINACAQLKD